MLDDKVLPQCLKSDLMMKREEFIQAWDSERQLVPPEKFSSEKIIHRVLYGEEELQKKKTRGKRENKSTKVEDEDDSEKPSLSLSRTKPAIRTYSSKRQKLATATPTLNRAEDKAEE